MENNNINEQIDNTFEQMRAEVTQQVMTELAQRNVDVIEKDYDAGAEVAKLISNYNATMGDIEAQIKDNNQKYKESVARVKNYELHLDKTDLKNTTIDKLDEILEKQQMLYEQEIMEKQASAQYKEAKNEVFGVLNLLKDCEIGTSKLLEIIDPLVKSSDIKALEIAGILLQKNQMAAYAIDSAIKGIEKMAANTELHDMVETMRDYISTGNDGLSYFAYMHKYQ